MLGSRRSRRWRRRVSEGGRSTVLGGLRALRLEDAQRFNGRAVAVFGSRLIEEHLLVWNATATLHFELLWRLQQAVEVDARYATICNLGAVQRWRGQALELDEIDAIRPFQDKDELRSEFRASP